jgi:quinol monooxygenase YgiN
MANVRFTIELTVIHSQVDNFKRLAKEMNAIVRHNEPETIQCQWFFHEGDDKWYLTETFVDSDAFLKHLEDAGPKLEEILEIAEVSRFEVFGDLCYSAKSVIATFGVKYFTFWDGVNRQAATVA